jgi:hypothetical protein
MKTNESQEDHEIRKLLYGESIAALKMKQLKRESWIKNVMHIYQVTREESEKYYHKIYND